MPTPITIAIASGKGGTGKTTLATNLALVMASKGLVQLIDGDVEEPNAHLFLDITLEKTDDVTIAIPKVDKEKCTFCGKCADFCQYHALAVLPTDTLFFPELCHGCGGCTLVCPEHAITEVPRVIGIIERGLDGNANIEFYHGLLNIGEPMATPVISTLQTKIDVHKPTILDAPPGTACPVIETISESDYCVLVTEPTPFGLWDLKLAVEVTRTLQVPFGVIINRDGIGDEQVERYCQSEAIPILMRIPQDEQIARLYSRGIPFIKELHEWTAAFKSLYETIQTTLDNN